MCPKHCNYSREIHNTRPRSIKKNQNQFKFSVLFSFNEHLMSATEKRGVKRMNDT